MGEQAVQHLDIGAGTIAYRWCHGPAVRPLVLLHGLGDSAIHTFASHFATGPLASTPLLLVDLPGFGEARYTLAHPASIARYSHDLALLLTTLGLNHVNLFGHSMGGNIAIRMTHQHAHLVSRLVVAEPLLEANQSVLATRIASVGEEDFVSGRYEMLVRATSLQAHRGDQVAAAFLQPLRLAHPVAMHRAACSLIQDGAPLATRVLPHLGVPGTMLVGERTPVDPAWLGGLGMPVVRIPNAGHVMMVEAAFATACAILEAIT